MDVAQVIASELSIQREQAHATIDLLDGGATVPFIARYRKEVTQNLSDAQLRDLSERLHYFRELKARKETVLASIEKQGKLSEELKKQIDSCLNKPELEDLYLPFKPKRKTKAQSAIAAGLLPLAEYILKNPDVSPTVIANDYLNSEHGIATVDNALEGAQYILMEQFSEDAALIKHCRKILWQHAEILSSVSDDSHQDKEKFRDYFDHRENAASAPSHRVLALLRGRSLGVLRVILNLDDSYHQSCLEHIANTAGVMDQGRAADAWMMRVVDWTWRIKVLPKLEVDCFIELRTKAEKSAIEVFAENLKHLLLAAPAGAKVTMGLDPGFRTGVKAVVVDETGKLLEYETIFPHAPQKKWSASLAMLKHLVQKHSVKLISIGNGTASRETDALVADLQKYTPELQFQKIMISEAGASVYSASELATKEFPDLDVSYRGAVSIARRLQDPLAELVKIDPKSIGVGQYQHDVNQIELARKLDAVVEDCVNQVGVDLNQASSALLRRIAGLNQTIADNIVLYREKHGAFESRESLKDVPRLGEKTFEQSAGFLRITGGSNLLDQSSVHPESYPLVRDILTKTKFTMREILGNTQALQSIKAKDYITPLFGLPTIKDILHELEKPGRDPRPEFKTASLRDDVEKISDLTSGMILEGTVTNVTHFGAFIDIGVHQDGLAHKSQLAAGYVENPADVIQVGQIVKVKVIEVDLQRKRISLTLNVLKSDPKQENVKNYLKNNKTKKPAAEVGGLGAMLKEAMERKQ